MAVPSRVMPMPVRMRASITSSSSRLPHSSALTGTRKVTEVVAVAPALASRRKKIRKARLVLSTASAIALP